MVARPPHFVLEQLAQGLDQLEAHIRRQAAALNETDSITSG